MEPLLGVIYISSETPLEKTNFSFVYGCQLETVSELGRGLMPNSPLITEIPSCVDLCVCYQNQHEFKCVPPLQQTYLSVNGSGWM